MDVPIVIVPDDPVQDESATFLPLLLDTPEPDEEDNSRQEVAAADGGGVLRERFDFSSRRR